MRRAAPIRLSVFLLLVPLCASEVRATPNHLQWIIEYLEEFSVVTDGGTDGPRDIMTTRLAPHPDEGFVTLIYRRASYTGASPKTLETTQLIHYTVRLAEVSPGSVEVKPVDAFNAGERYWIVTSVISGDAEYVPYTNIFERRMEDGSVDVTSSRGRVREVVIGYFGTKLAAERLADSFRELLTSLHSVDSDVQTDGSH